MSASLDPSLLEGLATTRAIRRYRPDPVSDDDLSAMLFAATRAPSGSNRQPARFLVLRDGPRAVQAKSLLGAAFREGWASKVVADGYQSGSGTSHDTPKARMAATMSHFVNHFESTPVVVLVCTKPRHHSLADGASVYPACQNLLLAARALGYGGVMTGWHHMVESELRTLLMIPDTIEIAATIPLGVPVGSHGPVRRRPTSEVVFDDGWGDQAAWVTEPEGTRHTSSFEP